MSTSLSEQIRRNEQQQARLDERRNALREFERKAETRKLFAAGRLVEKAGLSVLGTEELLGALLSLQRGIDDTKERAKWEAAGRERVALDAAEAAKVREPLLITFADPISYPTRTALRQAGFRWSKVFGHFEGMATMAEAEALATVHHGRVRRANAPVEEDELKLAAE
jgi:Conjugal transfer protein TraD